jgi:hypothetical protein
MNNYPLSAAMNSLTTYCLPCIQVTEVKFQIWQPMINSKEVKSEKASLTFSTGYTYVQLCIRDGLWPFNFNGCWTFFKSIPNLGIVTAGLTVHDSLYSAGIISDLLNQFTEIFFVWSNQKLLSNWFKIIKCPRSEMLELYQISSQIPW